MGIATLATAAGGLHATSVRPPEFAAMVNESDLVIRARVTAVRSEPSSGSRKIVTFVELDVLETVVGEPRTKVVLQMLGGRVGEEEMTVAGAPRFAVGDEDFLFVKGNGRSVHPLYAMMYGRYPVRRDARTSEEFVVRSNGVALRDTAEIALPMTEGPAAELQRRSSSLSSGLRPTEFVQRIRAAVRNEPPHARTR